MLSSDESTAIWETGNTEGKVYLSLICSDFGNLSIRAPWRDIDDHFAVTQIVEDTDLRGHLNGDRGAFNDRQ